MRKTARYAVIDRRCYSRHVVTAMTADTVMQLLFNAGELILFRYGHRCFHSCTKCDKKLKRIGKKPSLLSSCASIKVTQRANVLISLLYFVKATAQVLFGSPLEKYMFRTSKYYVQLLALYTHYYRYSLCGKYVAYV